MSRARPALVRLAILPAVLGFATGCGTRTAGETETEGDTEGEAEPVFSVEFDPSTDAVELLRDGEPLLRFPEDAFVIGTVPAIDDGLTYDPTAPLPDVTWRTPDAIELEPTEQGWRGPLRYGDGSVLDLEILQEDDGRWSASWVPRGGSGTIVEYRIDAEADPEEGFYGLGEFFDRVEHRGRTRTLALALDLDFEGSSNEMHVPVPFVTGTTGWGLFVEDPHVAEARLGVADDKEVRFTFGVGPAGGKGLRFHIYAAGHPLDVTRHYYETTGYPSIPARWALGPWIWRDENVDQAQVESDAAMLRSLDLAASALWIDRPYATGVNTFDFDPTRYPDPDRMISTLHELGLRVALWHTPYASDGDEPAPGPFAEAQANGYFPDPSGLAANPWGEPLDFTNSDAVQWWQTHLSAYTDAGIEGFKLDYGEDVVPGIGPARVPWGFADGRTEREMHSQYARAYHSVYAPLLPATGGFLLCRAGTYGDQTQVDVIWPGDLDADMTHFGDPGGGDRHVGGLPAAVIAGMSLGPSGFPLFASDTGGYRHSPPDRETFTRWFEHTALTPVMQIGTSSSDVAWEFTPENGFDDEMLGWYREYTRLHLRLFPYLWTHVAAQRDHGRPIVRPLGLAFPEVGAHPDDTYMLGDALLVAPVVTRGATTRAVMLPDGEWVEWFEGERHDGSASVMLAAPLGRLPLLLRAGELVAMLRPTVDSLSPTTRHDEVDSYDTDVGRLWVVTTRGPAAGLELYDGTVLEQASEGGSLSVSLDAGSEYSRGFVVEAIGMGAEPSSVTLDGDILPRVNETDVADGSEGWAWRSDRGGSVLVGAPAGGTVTLD